MAEIGNLFNTWISFIALPAPTGTNRAAIHAVRQRRRFQLMKSARRSVQVIVVRQRPCRTISVQFFVRGRIF
jgi:hypothetical protein